MIRQSLVMRGDDTPMKSKAVARNSFARQRRSVDGTGSGIAVPSVGIAEHCTEKEQLAQL